MVLNRVRGFLVGIKRKAAEGYRVPGAGGIRPKIESLCLSSVNRGYRLSYLVEGGAPEIVIRPQRLDIVVLLSDPREHVVSQSGPCPQQRLGRKLPGKSHARLKILPVSRFNVWTWCKNDVIASRKGRQVSTRDTRRNCRRSTRRGQRFATYPVISCGKIEVAGRDLDVVRRVDKFPAQRVDHCQVPLHFPLVLTIKAPGVVRLVVILDRTERVTRNSEQGGSEADP